MQHPLSLLFLAAAVMSNSCRPCGTDRWCASACGKRNKGRRNQNGLMRGKEIKICCYQKKKKKIPSALQCVRLRGLLFCVGVFHNVHCWKMSLRLIKSILKGETYCRWPKGKRGQTLQSSDLPLTISSRCTFLTCCTSHCDGHSLDYILVWFDRKYCEYFEKLRQNLVCLKGHNNTLICDKV